MGEVNVNVSKDLIEPIVRAEISAAIVRGLEGKEQMIGMIVSRVLSDKVNSEGKKDSYSHHNDTTMLEWLCQNMIREAAKAALATYIAEQKPRIEAELKKQLVKQQTGLATALVSGLSDCLKQDWRISLKVGLELPKE